MLYLGAACASLYTIAQVAEPVMSLRESVASGTGASSILGQALGSSAQQQSRLMTHSGRVYVDPRTGDITIPDSLSVDQLNNLLAGRSMNGLVPDASDNSHQSAADTGGDGQTAGVVTGSTDEGGGRRGARAAGSADGASSNPQAAGAVPAGSAGGETGSDRGGLVQAGGGATVHADPTVRGWFDQAVTMQHKGQLVDAQRLYLKILERNPNDAGVHRNLAIVYYQQGQFDKSWREVHTLKTLGHEMPGGFVEILAKAMPDPDGV